MQHLGKISIGWLFNDESVQRTLNVWTTKRCLEAHSTALGNHSEANCRLKVSLGLLKVPSPDTTHPKKPRGPAQESNFIHHIGYCGGRSALQRSSHLKHYFN